MDRAQAPKARRPQRVTDMTHKQFIRHSVEDTTGLDRAYASPNRLYQAGNTLYIAGTNVKSGKDIRDDLMLPFHQVKNTAKYREVEFYLEHAPLPVTRVVGHSLGAAVAKAAAQQHGLQHELYANPGFNFTGKKDMHSHRQGGDVISMFDRSSSTELARTANPHAYRRFGPR